jgi:tRNA threonylcarbamoyladenosine biosynthesis protein TsaB
MAEFRCLAIETATERASIALSAAGAVRVHALAASRNSSRDLYQAIRRLLEECEFELADLDCIAVGQGPGSFTGVRVAISATQGLAYSLDKPVCAVSSLAAQAAVAARDGGVGVYAVALDARMREAYVGLYECTANGEIQACCPDSLVAPEQFSLEHVLEHVLELDHGHRLGKVTAVGQGWQAYPQLLELNRAAILHERFDVWPDAAAVLALAARLYSNGDVLTAARALPNYLRNDVAHRATPLKDGAF